jgi:hypothetical protein
MGLVISSAVDAASGEPISEGICFPSAEASRFASVSFIVLTSGADDIRPLPGYLPFIKAIVPPKHRLQQTAVHKELLLQRLPGIREGLLSSLTHAV